MAKQMVVVLVIEADEAQEYHIRGSMRHWIKSCEAAYNAKIKLEEVGRPHMSAREALEIVEELCPNPNAKALARAARETSIYSLKEIAKNILQHLTGWSGPVAEDVKEVLQQEAA